MTKDEIIALMELLAFAGITADNHVSLISLILDRYGPERAYWVVDRWLHYAHDPKNNVRYPAGFLISKFRRGEWPETYLTFAELGRAGESADLPLEEMEWVE